MTPGSFVTVTGSALGMAKLVELNDEQARVEWFVSVAARRAQEVDPGLLKVAAPASQTRCYVRDEFDGPWRMGRIIRGHAPLEGEGRLWEVHFPDNVAQLVPEARVYVRCLLPGADPLDTLAARAQETPYFHPRRAALLDALVRQRAAAHGMTGLLSAPVRLYAHQVEIVRRVLEDPVQRYLLADEAGMGKTIEAGVIVRQVLLDDPAARALVVVPPLLLAPWHAELAEKLRLPVDDKRVRLWPADRLAELDPAARCDILVLDEAHQLAAAARAPERAALFAACQALAARAPRLLLLSAAPVLHHEQDFLAMLHLLEPDVYSLEDVASFRDRVARRQPVGRLLLGLREGTAGPTLRRALGTLRELFPGDAWIEDQADALQALCDAPELDREAADPRLRALRIRICETHRIHRRMLRTARAAAEGLSHRATGETAPLRLEDPCDERGPRLHELLDEWRALAAAAVLAAPEGERAALAGSLAEALATLAECLGSWLPLLEAATECRLAGDAAPYAERLGAAAAGALATAPRFEGEAAILQAMLAELRRVPDEDQLDTLASVLRLSQHPQPLKTVVFVTQAEARAAIAARLREALPPESVLEHGAAPDGAAPEQQVARFRAAAAPLALVCDRAGEEGLNLPLADRLVHFDLPWDPNRVEQRTGRLDRIGRTQEVPACLFVASELPHSLLAAWLAVLRDGFRVFHESIADLQCFIDRTLPELKRTALMEGAAGLRAAIPGLQAAIARERELLREQAALDEIEVFDREPGGFVAALRAEDGREAALQEALEGWLVDALRCDATIPGGRYYDRFGFSAPARNQPVVSFEATPKSLLPADWAARLNALQPELGTFQRELAVERGDLQLFRTGDPFVDTLARLVAWDDRGQAFCMWRQLPNQSADTCLPFFRLDTLIEADPRLVRRALREGGWPPGVERALLRQGDAWLPPQRRTLFLGPNLAPVTDAGLLRVLRRPYAPAAKGGTDTNLDAERQAALDAVVASERWPGLCQEVREQAEARIRRDAELVATVRAHAERARRELALRAEQQQQALRAQGGAEAALAERQAALAAEQSLYEALLAGVRRPRVQLDAVGFIVLSGRGPDQASSP